MSDHLQRVQAWISQPPQWVVIQAVDVPSGSELDNLDPGEQAAIVLAEQQGADLIVIDDLSGRQVAKSRQFRVTGLLGVLYEAARQNLVDLPEVIAPLQQTTFRASPKLIGRFCSSTAHEDKQKFCNVNLS